jgi:hypothetical protein
LGVSNVLRYFLNTSWIKLDLEAELKVARVLAMADDKPMFFNYIVVYKAFVVDDVNVAVLAINDMLKC